MRTHDMGISLPRVLTPRINSWWWGALLTAAVLILGYQVSYTYILDLGSPESSYALDGFSSINFLDEPDYLAFRWTGTGSGITFPAVSQTRRYQLSLRLSPGNRPADAPAPEVSLAVNGVSLAPIQLRPGLQPYRVTLDPSQVPAAPDMHVDVTSPTFAVSGGNSPQVGVMVASARLTPGARNVPGVDFPAAPYFLGWVVAGILAWAILAQTPLRNSGWKFGIALMAFEAAFFAGVILARPQLMLVTSTVCVFLGAAFVLASQLPKWIEQWRRGTGLDFEVLHTLGISDRRLRSIVEIGVVAALIGYLWFGVLLPFREHGLGDLITYYAAELLGVKGGDYYDYDQMQQVISGFHLVKGVQIQVNPPSSVVLLAPLALLPPTSVRLAWLLVNLVALLGGGLFLTLALRRTSPKPLSPVWVAGMIVFARPLIRTIAFGQVGAIIFFLLALGFWAWTRRQEEIAGGSVAIAAAIKIIPGIIILYFVWKRAWRGVAASAGIGIFLFALTFFVGGIQAWTRFLTKALPAVSQISAYLYNQSLIAFVKRFYLPNEGEPKFNFTFDAPGEALDLPFRLASYAIVIGSLLLLAWWIGRKNTKDELSRQLEFSAVVSVMLVVSPLVWDFYELWLILPIAAILNALTARQLPASAEIGLALGMGISWVLLQIEIGNLPPPPQTPVMLMSLYLYAALIVCSSACYLLKTGPFRVGTTSKAAAGTMVTPASNLEIGGQAGLDRGAAS